MLIVNDEQLRSVGIKSLSKRCPYCSKALAAYPLILSVDSGLFVYHAAYAAALVTEILVDLYTFFSPPAPYHQLKAALVEQAYLGTSQVSTPIASVLARTTRKTQFPLTTRVRARWHTAQR